MSQPFQARVSVVIPVRNEERNVERVARSVAAQEPVLEMIVVDDASTDRSGEILKRLAGEIPVLRLVRIESLPKGWTGKTYACALGADRAQGQWLLFTDADTEHLPGSLAHWVGRAERDQWDLVSLSPGQVVGKWWEKAVIPRVFVQLARWYPFEDISRPESPRAAANGQYLLMRREVYRKAGGFESVRNEILDDVRLAEKVKAAGGRILFAPGSEWVRTRMYGSFRAMWQGWTKNLYLLADGNGLRVMRALAGAWLLDVLPEALLLALIPWVLVQGITAAALAAFVACGAIIIYRGRKYAHQVQRLGYNPGTVQIYRPVGAWLFGLLLLNSFRDYRTRGSIEWKGRRYPVSAGPGQG